MKTRVLSCFLLIILILSCGNSGKKSGSGNARNIHLTDDQVQAYIKVAEVFYESAPELLENIQSQVPVDLSGNTDLITASGFKTLKEFSDASLVISICMNTIFQAKNMDEIQGKTKDDYIAEFTEGLDDEDEFDRQFREEMEKKLEETLSEAESEGLLGQNTNSMGTFIKLLKEKVGEKNTELVIKHYEELKNVWIPQLIPGSIQ